MDSKSLNRSAFPDHPLARLEREDLDLIVRFVLASGSLKELGKGYGVSYPTIRARLDELIERLRGVIEEREPDPVAELLGRLVARGELTPRGARQLRDLVRDSSDNTQPGKEHGDG